MKKAAVFFLGLLWWLWGGAFVLAAEPINLPMSVSAGGKILVDVKVAGKSITCIVDTGSPDFLLVDESIVNDLGLPKKPVKGELRFFSEDQGGETYLVDFPEVDIGPLAFQNVEGLTIDRIGRATGNGEFPQFYAQGILGAAFLEMYHIRIDYPNNKFLIFADGSPASPRAVSSWRPVLPVGPPGSSVPFLMDTGSSFSVASENVMSLLGLTFMNYSSGGPDPLFRGLAKGTDVRVGPVTFPEMTFEIAEHFEDYAGTGKFHGIIGYDYLKDFVIDLDLPHGRINIEKP